MKRFKIVEYNSELKKLEIENEDKNITIYPEYILIGEINELFERKCYSLHKVNLKLTNNRYYNLIIDSILDVEDLEHVLESILYHNLNSFEIERK